jgi:O-antigen/teichoic acid export membrane protein
MDLKRKVISGLGWSAAGRLLSQLATWAITLFVIRILSPEDYGLMALAGSLIALLTLLNELGLGAALIQQSKVEDAVMRQLFGLVLLINLALFGLAYVLAPFISAFFEEDRLIPIIRLLSVQLVIGSFAIIPQSLIDRNMLFKRKSIVEFVCNLFGALATLGLAVYGFGVYALVFGCLATTLFRTIGINFACPYTSMPVFRFTGLGHLIGFGTYVAIDRVQWFFFSQADVLIIGKMLGKELLGIYSVAMDLASLPMAKVSGILNQVAFPAFASIQHEREQVAYQFLKAIRLVSFFSFPALWGLSSVAPELIGVLLGPKWHECVIPLQLLSLTIPIRMITNIMSPTLMGIGRPDISLQNGLLLTISLPLGFFVGVHWGLLGVSLAWVSICPLAALINLARVGRILGIRFFDIINSFVWTAIASLIMFVCVVIVRSYDFFYLPLQKNLIVLIMIGVVTYMGSVLLINRNGFCEVLKLGRLKMASEGRF